MSVGWEVNRSGIAVWCDDKKLSKHISNTCQKSLITNKIMYVGSENQASWGPHASYHNTKVMTNCFSDWECSALSLTPLYLATWLKLSKMSKKGHVFLSYTCQQDLLMHQYTDNVCIMI